MIRWAAGRVPVSRTTSPPVRDIYTQTMHISLINRAAVFCASALAFASAAFSQDWTSLKVGELANFSFSHAFLPDGRFLFGTEGKVFVQDAFGAAAKTQVLNSTNILLDPSFVAARSDTQALVGGGGYLGPSGVYLFNPSSPGTTLVTPALTTLQNYNAVFWKHPTSSREGWIIGGANAGFSSNLTFVSIDGTFVGNLTSALSDYSGGLAVDATGNIFVSLAGPDAATNNKVIKFTADQIDTAAQAVLSGTPAPLAVTAATSVFTADASGALAVDAAGHLWITGYQIGHIQAYDPATGVTRRVLPDHPALAGAFGAPAYSVKVFTKDAAEYVSFLVNDSFYSTDSDLLIGYRPSAELEIRSAQITTASQSSKEEETKTIPVTVTLSSADAAAISVPVTLSGTAIKDADYTTNFPETIEFAAGETTKTFNIAVLLNDPKGEGDETVVVTLGNPTPSGKAGLGALNSEKFTLTIKDNNIKPEIATTQNFGTLRVGSAVNYTVATVGAGIPVKWTAKGLPPGLKINADGTITGTPTAFGEYDQVILTATNAFGTTTSVVFFMNIQPFPAGAVGTFSGLVDRSGTDTNGLGASVSLTATSKATYTGKVLLGKTSYAIKGNLNAATVNPTGFADLKIGTATKRLSFQINSTTGALTGSMPDEAELAGWRAQTATDRTGIYNFSAASEDPAAGVPQGASYGSLKLSTKAVATVTGMTADGSKFTASSPLSINGDIVIYQALYTAPALGTFGGKLNLADNLTHTISGDLSWSKPAQLKGPLYKDGWPTPLELEARGGKYRPAAGATLPLAATASTSNNAQIILQDGGIEAIGDASNPKAFPLRIDSATKLVIAAPHKVKLTNTTGAFSGSVTLGEGSAKKVIAFQGLLVPNVATANAFDADGYGYFILPTATAGVSRSGGVVFEAYND